MVEAACSTPFRLYALRIKKNFRLFEGLDMGLWESYCGDTSLHGYQYIGRKEKRVFWTGIVLGSYVLAIYFLGSNISDYMDSSTVTTLQSTTSSLNNIFYPSVTVCNTNQIRKVGNVFQY